MTDEGKARLMEHEGNVLHCYPDSLGFFTIGIGHCIDKRKSGQLKPKFIQMIFEDDLEDAASQAALSFPWFEDLDHVRQDVIVMLVFNMGIGNLGGFRLMIDAIKRKDWTKAAWELNNSLWARQVGHDRKVELCEALEKGTWNKNTKADHL